MTRTEKHDGLYGLPPQHVWQYDIFTNATRPDDRELSNRIVHRGSSTSSSEPQRGSTFVVELPPRR